MQKHEHVLLIVIEMSNTVHQKQVAWLNILRLMNNLRGLFYNY